MNKIKVEGPKEVLKALTEKLKENGFKEKAIYLSMGREYILFIQEKTFYMGCDINCMKNRYVIGDTANKTYNVLESWNYLSSLEPEETEFQPSKEDWVWARRNTSVALVKWTKNERTYGFNFSDEWTNEFFIHNPKCCLTFTKASKEEVEARLQKEAHNKGLVEGVTIDNSNIFTMAGGKREINIGVYQLGPSGTVFLVDGWAIMENGKWAKTKHSKYQLLEWYPGLPKDWAVGMRVKQENSDPYQPYYPMEHNFTNQSIAAEEVKQNPKFWKEVVEKDYEILSFWNGAHKTRITKVNKFKDPIENVLHNPYWKIYSVKRLSDEKVFTVGDKVSHFYDGYRGFKKEHKWKIAAIEIRGNKCLLFSGTGFHKELKNVYNGE